VPAPGGRGGHGAPGRGVHARGGLTPGATRTVTASLPIPATTAETVAGVRIVLTADSEGQVVEVDEANNERETGEVTVFGQALH
jgi:hypothetical protein